MDETWKYQILVLINTGTLLPTCENLLLKNYISYILIINTYIALNSQEMEYFFFMKMCSFPNQTCGRYPLLVWNKNSCDDKMIKYLSTWSSWN